MIWGSKKQKRRFINIQNYCDLLRILIDEALAKCRESFPRKWECRIKKALERRRV